MIDLITPARVRKFAYMGFALTAFVVTVCLPSRHAEAQIQRALGLDVSHWQGDMSQTTWNNLHTANDRDFAPRLFLPSVDEGQRCGPGTLNPDTLVQSLGSRLRIVRDTPRGAWEEMTFHGDPSGN